MEERSTTGLVVLGVAGVGSGAGTKERTGSGAGAGEGADALNVRVGWVAVGVARGGRLVGLLPATEDPSARLM